MTTEQCDATYPVRGGTCYCLHDKGHAGLHYARDGAHEITWPIGTELDEVRGEDVRKQELAHECETPVDGNIQHKWTCKEVRQGLGSGGLREWPLSLRGGRMSKQELEQARFICPKCGQPLTEIRYPSDSMLNRDQWESQLPGDLFCTCHNNYTGNKPYAYFWKSDFKNRALVSSDESRTVISSAPTGDSPKGQGHVEELEQEERKAFEQMRRDFIEISKPFVEVKVDILNANIPSMILYPDGHIETKYSPEVEAQLESLDRLCKEAWQAHLARSRR